MVEEADKVKRGRRPNKDEEEEEQRGGGVRGTERQWRERTIEVLEREEQKIHFLV